MHVVKRRRQSILFGRRVFRYFYRTEVTSASDLQENHKCTDRENHYVPLIKKALLFGNDYCIKDFAGQYTYLHLYHNSERLSRQISNICGSGSSSTVAFFGSNDILTMIILWASWMSGQKAMALKRGQPDNILIDLVQRTKVKLIISSDLFEKCSRKLAVENSIPLIHIDHKFLNIYKTNNRFKHQVRYATQKGKLSVGVFLNEYYMNTEAIIVYTSEKVFKTKTHKKLETHIKNTVQSWNVSKDDKILYMCPSFHSYNDEYIFNLLSPLSMGSQVYLLEPYDSRVAWRTILGINIPTMERKNALIAEPKVYQQLIQEYEKMFAGDKQMVEYIREYCLTNIRLMITCFYRPDPIISSTWLKITGHCLQDSNYSFECSNSKVNNVQDENAHVWFPTKANIRVRIVNAKNNVLLEVNGTQTERFLTSHTTVIGRVMLSNNDNFFSTGEIVSYCSGVLKIIGRYPCT